MTVPVAIKELEKIEMIRQSDDDYRLAYAVTATQREILKAFNMAATNIREQAISDSDKSYEEIVRFLRTEKKEKMKIFYVELSEIMGTLEAYEMKLGMMITNGENKKAS